MEIVEFEERLRQQCRFMDWLTDEDMRDRLIADGLWSMRYEDDLAAFAKSSERLKHKMYLAYLHNPPEVDRLRTLLRAMEDDYERLFMLRHSGSPMTLDGYIKYRVKEETMARLQLDASKKPLWNGLPEYRLFNAIAAVYNQQDITTIEYRQVARHDMFRAMWTIYGKDVFEQQGEEQRILASYSRMYDAIYASNETPDEEIIEDDDLLDGWLVDQREKNKETKETKIQTEAAKAGNKIQKGEIFIPARNAEEAKKIHAMNSKGAAMIKKQREALIAQKGMVVDAEFLDKKLERQQQLNALMTKGQ